MPMFSLPYLDAMTAFAAFAQDPGVVFLNGSRVHNGESRYSYLAIDPVCSLEAGASFVEVNGRREEGDPLSILKRELQNFETHPIQSPVPFCGGAIGALGYELGAHFETLPQPKRDDLALPLMHMGIYDTFAAFDHVERKLWVVGSDQHKTQSFAHRLQAVPKQEAPLEWTRGGVWSAEQNKSTSIKNIRTIIDYINAGDILQANYTQKFRAKRPLGLDDLTLYRRLCALSPAPFSAFLRCGHVTLAGISPERFLRLRTDRHLEAWPIKGTRARDHDPVRDCQLAEELKESTKDYAENLMIVDLMRNDLARVCEIGSVHVSRLCELETFASVHHLVSCIEGRVCHEHHPVDVLRATFPGGSITGAPKIRAMEIIHELEPSPRGYYCGCLGWIGFDGAMDMSMTIRTLTMTDDTLIAQAGGGIVADSDPDAEYEECMIKIEPLLQTLTRGRP